MSSSVQFLLCCLVSQWKVFFEYSLPSSRGAIQNIHNPHTSSMSDIQLKYHMLSVRVSQSLSSADGIAHPEMSFSGEDAAPGSSDEELNIENILIQACNNLLQHYLTEDHEDAGDDATKELADQLMGRIMKEERPLKTEEDLVSELNTMFPCDCVKRQVLQSLAQELRGPMVSLQKCDDCHIYFHWHVLGHNQCYQSCLIQCQDVMKRLQKHIQCQETLDALFKDERGLNFQLFKEIKATLGKEHWNRICTQLEYCAMFKESELLNSVSQSGSDSDTEPPRTKVRKKKRPERQRTDIAIGDRKEDVGFYIELAKNPTEEKIRSDRKKLQEVLAAERVMVPGNFHTTREKRVSYQIIFYTENNPNKVSQPEEMEDSFNEKTIIFKWVWEVSNDIKRQPKSEIHVWLLKILPNSDIQESN